MASLYCQATIQTILTVSQRPASHNIRTHTENDGNADSSHICFQNSLLVHPVDYLLRYEVYDQLKTLALV